MKVKSYRHIGKRENNEDNLAIGANTFIVCDGVGGREFGEKASEFVAENLLEAIENSSIPVNEEILQMYVKNVQEKLNDFSKKDPESKGMATTLAMFTLGKDKAYIAHIGDSRVYYIKPKNKIYWHTKDHSLVAELVDAGVITPEKALTHPKKNQITRAIQANYNNKTVKASITKLDKMEPGDLIFICSDGVTESLPDEDLVNILIQNSPIKDKINSIQAICSAYSNDNNTAILIKIEKEDAFDQGENNIEFIPLATEILKDNNDIINEDEVETEQESASDDKSNYVSNIDDDSDQNISDNEEPVFEEPNLDEEFEQEPVEKNSETAKTSHNNSNIESEVKDIYNKPKSSAFNFIFIILLIIGIAAAGFWYYTNYLSNTKNQPLKENINITNTQSKKKSNIKRINNSTEEKLWNNAKKNKKYDEYLITYPNGIYAKQAKEEISKKNITNKENQAWKTAKQKNTIEAYNNFIKNYPEGNHIEEAKKTLDDLSNQNSEKKAMKK